VYAGVGVGPNIIDLAYAIGVGYADGLEMSSTLVIFFCK
jgi:hypothetical protein